MKLIGKLFLGLALGLMATASFAQFDDMAGVSVDYMPLIFLNPKVAADMHLSTEVASKEQSLIIQQGMAMLPAAQMGASSTPAQKKQMAAKLFAGFKKMQDASLAPLNAAQRVRYHQLSLQFRGVSAMVDPKVATSLGLNAGQKSKLQAAISVSNKATLAAARGAQKGGADMMNALTNMRSARARSAVAQDKAAKTILTSAQWAKWQTMLGKPLPGIGDLLGGGMGMGMG